MIQLLGAPLPAGAQAGASGRVAAYGFEEGPGTILDNAPAPSRLYVNASASGANNGASWGNAFRNLQDALQAAARTAGGVTEIWVARGTYTPAGADGDREAAFRLSDGLAIYGGFAGGETNLAQRQPSVCVTVLSGDLNHDDGSGGNDENSYHVVDGSNTGATAVLDGFTITAGYANVDTPNHEGAGVLILAGSPTLRNCVIAGNHTGDGHDVDDPQFAQGGAGGGLFSEGGAPTLINCTITSNSTGNGGKILGTSYNDGGNGGAGGGICCSQSDITMIGCLVAGNTTGRGYSDADVRRPGKGGSGAGMYLESSTPQLINCRFLDNVTGAGGAGAGTPGGNGGNGGGLYMETSGINGLRFHNNSAWHITGDSSGLRFYSPASGGNVATNNLWYDCQSLGFNQVSHDYNHYSATDFTFEYTEHPGMHDTVTTGDPFVNVAARDFHLARATSRGVALAAPYTTDPDGLARGADGVWDRGAYEFVALPRPVPTPTPVPTPDPGSYHYVRAGASGSGTDWANAYGQLPPTLVRGDTYYIADGTYPGYNITGPLSGTTPIVIKKATVQAHGTNVGWDSRYGDGVATWGPMSVDTSHVIFDGVTGAGRSGHGFEIYSAGGGTDLIDMYGSPDGLVLGHIQMHFSSRDVASGAAIYGAESASNITISNCYIHDIPGCPLLIRNWTGLLFERNWVARNKSTAESHAEGISTHGGGNFTIRNNVWEDIEGTAVIVNLYGATRNWDIYGNVFFETGLAGGLGHGLVSDNFFAETPRIINCVIAGNRTGRGGASSGAAGGSGGNGGGICSVSPVSIENCTIIDNAAGPGGTGATPGAAGLGGGLHSASFTTVANSILWGNHATAPGEPSQITGSAEINASCVEGWTGAFGGTRNHGLDPLLANPARRDYHLTLESPCLDAGDKNLVRDDTLDLDHDGNTEERVPLDLDGNSRFADGTGCGQAVVDMGAFERVGPVPALWIPAVTCSPLETTRILSIMATRVSNLNALTNLRITYDARVLRLPTITRVQAAALLTGWSVMAEVDESTSIGLLRISAAGTAAVTAALPVALLNMEFDVIGQVGDRTDLTMTGGYLQDEAGREITVELNSGRLEIAPLPGIRTISGRIGYWPDPAGIAVPGATLAIVPPVAAAALTSASTGTYRFRNLPDGLDYTVTPGRPGVSEPCVITAYDATLILKSTVGSTTLNAWQRLAADVSGEGAISALDATQILQYTVGQRALPFPAGAVWGFTPARRQYRLLASDQVNQDYTGILYGDVDGNWRPVSRGSSPLWPAAPQNALAGARLWISQIRIDPPGRVLVEISGQGLERAIAMTDIRLVWDPAVLGMPSASRVQLGASIADSLAAVAADGPGGTVRVSLARTVPIALPEATVLNVLFDLKRTTRGATSVLDLVSGRLEDPDGHEIPLILTGGTFRLEAPFGTAVRDWRSYD